MYKNQYNQKENDSLVIHSYFEESEADCYFKEMDIIYKENRVLERIYEGEKIRQGFVDYVVKKSADKNPENRISIKYSELRK